MKLKYVELPIERVWNWLSPVNCTAWYSANEEYRNKWWEDKIVEERQTYCDIWTQEYDKITNHFSNLEKSIAEQGILTPIYVVYGNTKDVRRYPPIFQKSPEQLLYSHWYGGSRLTLAEKLGIKTIPCAVEDTYNQFPDALEITGQNYKKWFKTGYTYCSQVPNIRASNHCHMLIDSKYNSMNQNTRNAQQTASSIAAERIGWKHV